MEKENSRCGELTDLAGLMKYTFTSSINNHAARTYPKMLWRTSEKQQNMAFGRLTGWKGDLKILT
jgi:hypothetical protein